MSQISPMDERSLAAQARRKAAWRLIPFLCVLYILNILDRTNLGFARITMEKDLNLEPRVFDIGYGIFYLGYLAFEVPANLLLLRIGARRWIARIMISWGLVSSAMMAVNGPVDFCVLRVLLGIAEAGFFPGIILYLTYWFPDRERARVIALFMTAISLSGVIGNPISGTIMEYLDGARGLEGWRWLFLLEGIPSVLIGFMVFFYLPDGPMQANWLTPAEKAALVSQLRQAEPISRTHGSWFQSLMTGHIWLLILIYFTVAAAANAGGAQFPAKVKGSFSEYGPFVIGWLTSIPHVCAIMVMTLLGLSSDLTGERRFHVAFAAFLGASGWLLAERAEDPWLVLIGLCLAQAGMMAMLPLFWAMTTASVRGTTAAGGIALINSVANIGGAISPYTTTVFGFETMAYTLVVGGIFVFVLPLFEEKAT